MAANRSAGGVQPNAPDRTLEITREWHHARAEPGRFPGVLLESLRTCIKVLAFITFGLVFILNKSVETSWLPRESNKTSGSISINITLNECFGSDVRRCRSKRIQKASPSLVLRTGSPRRNDTLIRCGNQNEETFAFPALSINVMRPTFFFSAELFLTENLLRN